MSPSTKLLKRITAFQNVFGDTNDGGRHDH